MSRVLTGLGATAAGLAAVAATLPDLARSEAAEVRHALTAAVSGVERAPIDLAMAGLARVARMSAGPAAAACAGAVLVGLAQTGGLFAPEAIRLRLERLDPAAGLRRLFTPVALGRAAHTTAVSAAALALGLWLLAERLPTLLRLPRLRPSAAWSEAAGAAAGALVPVLVLLAAAASFDLLLQRHRHLRGLRMTRAEVEREFREDEGDPRLRAERRRLQASVGNAPRRATCVVVNPTRIAVALAHRLGGDDAPVVLGKGTGARAAALRREARRLGVPVVHDRELARALFRLAEVGEAIPEELYEATAAVLAWVHGLDAGGRA